MNATGLLSEQDVAAYRRDGYLVVRQLFSQISVESCRRALIDLAAGHIATRETQIAFEAGYDPAQLAAAERQCFVRKYMDFIEEAPALKAVAMNRRLHRLLDQLLGSGRVLFQEMALVKPARIGSEKPWHQDAAYFRVSDPGLIIGVWIALDPATRSNGCMEVVAGSHLHGAQPHRHENDLNRCRLQPQSIHTSALQLEMQPGDALLFHPLLHHRTAANTSQLRRRALQFHYHQLGAVWGDIADHRRLFHDEKGNYAGCTRLHESLTAAGVYTYRGPLARTIVLQDEMAG